MVVYSCNFSPSSTWKLDINTGSYCLTRVNLTTSFIKHAIFLYNCTDFPAFDCFQEIWIASILTDVCYFSISQRMGYMTFGIGLMIGPGNPYVSVWFFSVQIAWDCIYWKLYSFTAFCFNKVSSRACYWWNCLSWTNIDSRHLVVVCILNEFLFLENFISMTAGNHGPLRFSKQKLSPLSYISSLSLSHPLLFSLFLLYLSWHVSCCYSLQLVHTVIDLTTVCYFTMAGYWIL